MFDEADVALNSVSWVWFNDVAANDNDDYLNWNGFER
jgi:hypothetical protein